MDSFQALSEPARVRVGEALARLAVEAHELPAMVLTRLHQRSRNPGARIVVGRYLLVGELGRGGMGVVYDAWDPSIERRVAIKTLEPELVQEEERDEVVTRFRRETKVVGQLKHPAIVTIFDFGYQRDVHPVTGVPGPALYYYVMEYLEGQSLAEALRDRGRMPDLDAVAIAAVIAEALQIAHDAGIIHRDIKPSNIFLRNGREAVLLDFGIAKVGDEALTRQGQILGTPSYLAPERLKEKERPIDGRADIFSLGILLYTMLAGAAPFVGHDVYEVIDKISKQAHPDVGRLGATGRMLSRVLDRMLAKRPEDRYATAGEAAADLRRLERSLTEPEANGDPTPVEPTPAFEATSPPARADDEPPPLPDRRSPAPASGEGSPDQSAAGGAARVGLAATADLQEIGPRFVTRLDPWVSGALGVPPEGVEDRLQHGEKGAPRPAASASTGGAAAPPEGEPDVGPDDETVGLIGGRSNAAIARRSSKLRIPAVLPDDEPAADASATTAPELGRRTAAGDPEVSANQPGPGPEPELRSFAEDSHPEDPGGVQVAFPRRETAGEEPIGVQAGPGEASAVPSRKGPWPALSDPQFDSGFDGGVGRAHRVVVTEPVLHRKSRDLPTGMSARGRGHRPRIEAALVDESQVVVRPSSLDSARPDELPTQTAFPAQEPAPANATGRPEFEDPAERRRATAGSSEMPSQPPRTAAVARQTIGSASGPTPASQWPSVQIRMSGRGLIEEAAGARRKRWLLLVAGGLASAAIGLMLGRLRQTEGHFHPVNPAGGAAPRIIPRAATDPARGEQPALVRPRTARELVLDADAALAEGRYADAAQLYTRALAALPPKHDLHARARFRRADALRELGRLVDATSQYREVIRRHPDSAEAHEARARLRLLTSVRDADGAGGERAADRAGGQKAAPGSAPAGASGSEGPKRDAVPADLPPEAACRWIATRYLTDADAAVVALQRLQRAHPREPCVFWSLARKYEALERDSAALDSYRRFLSLDPKTRRAPAVRRRIADLEAKLGAREPL